MHAAHEYNDNSLDYEDDNEGPIIQEIPGGLIIGDFIEIHGFCRGPEVIVQLLTSSRLTPNEPEVLPLHITLSAGGPVMVKSRSKNKVERQEYNVRNCPQPNLTFQLCIYALEEGFQVKLNNEIVCTQKHTVDLENIVAISMDGDAEFTSIEFKEIYGEDDESYHADAPEPGLMRVQELRESFSRKKGSPVLVRSSIRRSNRTANAVGAAVVTKTAWPTSEDLSRPDLDIDNSPVTLNQANVVNSVPNYSVERVQVRSIHAPIPNDDRLMSESSPKSSKRFSLNFGNRKSVDLENSRMNHLPIVGEKSYHTLPGEEHAGTYRPLELDPSPDYRSQTMYVGSATNLNASSQSLTDPNKKKRSSLFSSKSKKSKGSESDISIGGTEKSKRKGIKNIFKTRKSITVNSPSDIRHSLSLPDVSQRESYSVDRIPVIATKSESPYFGIAADVAPPRGPVPKGMLKQAAPEIASFMSAQKAVPSFENFALTDPSAFVAPSLGMTPVMTASQRASQPGPIGDDRKLKGTAPEMADILINKKTAGFDQVTTLTTSSEDPTLTIANVTAVGESRKSSGQSTLKLKGPAPEVASLLHVDNRSGLPMETTLTNERTFCASAPLQIITAPPQTTKKTGKYDGPAAEVAAEHFESHRSRQNLFSDTTLTSTQSTQKPITVDKPIVIDRKITVDRPMIIDRPMIDKDHPRSEPILVEQQKRVQSAQPGSSDRRKIYNGDSDQSSIHSDEEYYLDVGKSDYYLERRRSLKNYRSRRSRVSQSSLSGRNDSTRSSVSSIHSDDRVMGVKSRPQQATENRNLPVNGTTGYVHEPYIQPSRDSRPRVYAAAPIVQQPAIADLTVEVIKLKENDYKARLPLQLTTGRGARLTGHFTNSSPSDPECCFIHLEFDQIPQTANISEIILQTWSNGNVTIYGIQSGQQHCLNTWEGGLPISRENQTFGFEFNARGSYFAITLDNLVTLIVTEEIDTTKLETFRLDTCENAVLDHLAVNNNLLLPLDLSYPEQSHRTDVQSLLLNVKFAADSKFAILKFITQTHKRFVLIIDFSEDAIYVKTKNTNEPVNVDPDQKRSIPLVPEQIKNLKILRYVTDNRLKVYAEQTELFDAVLPLARPVGKLSSVHIDGDLTLINAKFG